MLVDYIIIVSAVLSGFELFYIASLYKSFEGSESVCVLSPYSDERARGLSAELTGPKGDIFIWWFREQERGNRLRIFRVYQTSQLGRHGHQSPF